MHLDALDTTTLVYCVLESALAAPVNANLAVLLHFEFDGAILAPQAVTGEQPLTVAKCIVRHVVKEFEIVQVCDLRFE